MRSAASAALSAGAAAYCWGRLRHQLRPGCRPPQQISSLPAGRVGAQRAGMAYRLLSGLEETGPWLAGSGACGATATNKIVLMLWPVENRSEHVLAPALLLPCQVGGSADCHPESQAQKCVAAADDVKRIRLVGTAATGCASPRCSQRLCHHARHIHEARAVAPLVVVPTSMVGAGAATRGGGRKQPTRRPTRSLRSTAGCTRVSPEPHSTSPPRPQTRAQQRAQAHQA